MARRRRSVPATSWASPRRGCRTSSRTPRRRRSSTSWAARASRSTSSTIPGSASATFSSRVRRGRSSTSSASRRSPSAASRKSRRVGKAKRAHASDGVVTALEAPLATLPRGSAGPPRARWLVVLAPYLWLLVFFLIPFAIVIKISLSATAVAQPPYEPNFDLAAGLAAILGKIRQFSLDNYEFLTTDALYIRAYLSSIEIAVLSTFLTLLVGYPIAYGMARAPRAWQPTLVMLVILPFWTSFLIRVYAWIGILKKEGLLNQLLLSTGLISEPLTILDTNWAVY